MMRCQRIIAWTSSSTRLVAPSINALSTSVEGAVRPHLPGQRVQSVRLVCKASKRPSTIECRGAAQALMWLGIPSSSCSPRSASSNRLPRSLRVLSAMTTPFGSAKPRRRAAIFGVSPRYVAPAPPLIRSDRRQPSALSRYLPGRRASGITPACAACYLLSRRSNWQIGMSWLVRERHGG